MDTFILSRISLRLRLVK